ncbi:putative RNA polymerase II subunit B1 CTD phosphatase rpap2 isoform X1 [Takifugu flavidus]|uniref:RNA polymerase II subunit B1 CTD phosphatase RPAP2 homolog n=1 Tax=Takifugu flavidus TaxID=433684 RepID=A0A5C6NZ11_9TELE|nr:putative RNA polymerase II subunit B1 CTD phosphatase rpap2 isoform X1 [Takifugu flavidus]TWW72764.1 putative RNA polymerase II subunit B1 CTD phosphatase rpap2 [Takifugu flavidus]
MDTETRCGTAGIRTKTRSTKEDARRMEVTKKQIKQKSELEKKALRIVECLLEDDVTEEFLTESAQFITPAHYKDATEERSIIKVCGYPLCSNRLDNVPNQKYKISTKSNRIYDLTVRKCFCSNFCYKASKHFELQISSTPLWMRGYGSPSEIILMKKGDVYSDSVGEEVMLLNRLQEKDVEDPQPEQPCSSEMLSAEDDLNHNYSDQEQDFLSRVLSEPQGRRVHWGSLPTEAISSPEDTGVEEVTSEMTACTLSGNSVTPPIMDSDPMTSPPPNVSQCPPSTMDLTSLKISQVGVSKSGAAGLQDVLRKHSGTKPDLLQQNLLMCLRGTLKDWCTESTLDLLYGAGHPPESNIFTDAGEEKEEELDEDDLDDDEAEDIDAPGPKKAPSSVPDFETLRKDTQEFELRVREFYKGTWILPDEEEKPGKRVTAQDQPAVAPALPLVDSRAQHTIQKRITVEKLTSCLKNIIGPLQLTLSDITTDLNELVRTFKFTNKNIIHKTPEWTIIAVVLLHVLSAVSPLVREALEAPAFAEYRNTLMKDLGLREQDLLDLVRVFKMPPHIKTRSRNV